MTSFTIDMGRRSARAGLLANLAETFRQWTRRAHARRELASLDDHLLRDVGIDRATAMWETSKPFWRA